MQESDKLLLVLDLDETLIHASKQPLELTHDFMVFDFYVYQRPNLQWFLKKASNSYQLAIWSSASDDYVQAIAKKIKPENVDFQFIWGRSRCTTRRDYDLDQYFREKRLKKLKRHGYSLEKILIVDNTPEKLKDNYGNAIYIKSFEGDQSDNYLTLLYNYLETLKETTNVRIIEKRGWDV